MQTEEIVSRAQSTGIDGDPTDNASLHHHPHRSSRVKCPLPPLLHMAVKQEPQEEEERSRDTNALRWAYGLRRSKLFHLVRTISSSSKVFPRNFPGKFNPWILGSRTTTFFYFSTKFEYKSRVFPFVGYFCFCFSFFFLFSFCRCYCVAWWLKLVFHERDKRSCRQADVLLSYHT